MRVGIVNRFSPGPYRLGEALEVLGFDIVPLELGALGWDGRGLTSTAIPVTVDVALWRVSENLWPACAPLARAIEDHVRLVNSATVIARCADKLATAACLTRAGIPVVAGQFVAPGAAVPDLGPATVVKPVAGARARGVHLATAGELLPGDATEAWMAQAWAGDSIDHVRALVVGTDVVYAYRRVAARGVVPSTGSVREAVDAPGEVRQLAVAAARATGARLAGVDLVPDPWRVLEVNSCSGIPPDALAATAEGLAEILRRP